MVDKFTKWVVATPCRANPTSEETAELLLNHAIYAFGIPKVILSDRGTQFVSKIWKSILDQLGVDRRLATPRLPNKWPNGTDEWHPQTAANNAVF